MKKSKAFILPFVLVVIFFLTSLATIVVTFEMKYSSRGDDFVSKMRNYVAQKEEEAESEETPNPSALLTYQEGEENVY